MVLDRSLRGTRIHYRSHDNGESMDVFQIILLIEVGIIAVVNLFGVWPRRP